MKNRKMSAKKRFLILGVIFFGVLFLGIFFIILPTIKEINELRNDILSKKIELEESLLKEKNMSKLNEKIKTIEPKLEELDNIYINENQELEFITTLENTAIENNVTQNINLLTGNVTQDSGHKIIPLNINISGTYRDAFNYLTSLESLSYYLSVNSVEIISGKKPITNNLLKGSVPEDLTPQSDTVQMNINANTYWK